jgi:pimeloyl-ACP methyl ester carboxylesterase/DNA-binding winged helix-turn-helix (wHTH) protein
MPVSMLLKFGRCELDVERRELRRDGGSVHVEPQVFDLLVYLVARRDRVVGKEELLAALWSGRVISDATLASRINAARQAIGDSGQAQQLLRTVARRGFHFIAAVEEEGQPSIRRDEAQPGARQDVTFCRTSDGVRLAIASVGEGRVLLKTANWLNHVEYDWQSPLWSPTLARWASTRRLVRYDQRGTGLSDWEVAEISLEAFVRDLEAVVDKVCPQRFALLGISQGAAVALSFAAKHPDRVEKLVLHGAYALGRNKREAAADHEQASAYLTLIRHGWGYRNSAFMQAFSSLYLPGGSAEQVKWFADLQRMTASPENAIRIRQACDDIDVMSLLPQIRVPTLVLHSRNDGVVAFDHGRMIASAIPGARFVGLESGNHIVLPDEAAWGRFMGEIEGFLEGMA